MKQIITGPYGRIAYFNPTPAGAKAYPALNLPSCDFARAKTLKAANSASAPQVIRLPRSTRRNAALAMFGAPERR